MEGVVGGAGGGRCRAMCTDVERMAGQVGPREMCVVLVLVP